MTKGIVTCNLRKRLKKPSVNAERNGHYKSGEEIEIVDVVKGDPYEGVSTWYKLSTGIFVWSGGVSLGLESNIFEEKLRLDQEKNDGSELTSELEEELTNFSDLINSAFSEGRLVKPFNYNHILDVGLNFKSAKGQNILVGIVDTGINKSHEVFRNAFEVNTNDGIGNHGILIASIIGARNAKNLTGLAPMCSLIDYKTFEDKGFNPELMIKAIKEFRNQSDLKIKGKVLNISLGLEDEDISHDLDDEISLATEDCILVSAAGEVSKKELTKESRLQYPSRKKKVISVGSIKESDLMNPDSLNPDLDFLVPDFRFVSARGTNDYGVGNGRDSVATAVVSGLISLLISSDFLGEFPSYDKTVEVLNEIAIPVKKEEKFNSLKLYKP